MSESSTPMANPTDTPLTAVLDDLRHRGYVGQFAVRSNGRIECLTCRHTDDAGAYDADEVTRLEGASDPDDMVMVAPLCCTSCGTKGALTLSYGPASSPEDSDVVVALDRTPHEPSATRPAQGAAPGIR